jgi:Lon protease-like protein
MAILPDSLPVFTLPNLVLYPHADLPLRIYDPIYKRLIDDVAASSRMMVICQTRSVWNEIPGQIPALYPIGTVALITANHRSRDGGYSVFVHGLMKVEMGKDLSISPYRVTRIKPVGNESELYNRSEIAAFRANILHKFYQASAQGIIGPFPDGALSRLEKATEHNFLALSAALLALSPDQQQQFLELDTLEQRFELLTEAFTSLLLTNATLGDGMPESEGEFTH